MTRSIRDSRERWVQAVCYEVGGIVVMTPLCSSQGLLEPRESVGMLATLSIAVMAWSVAFNGIFDRLERGWTGRLASDRPHGLRLFHAALFEATAVVATCPLIIGFTGWSFARALGADLALCLLYAVYGYVFQWSYDRWRPVARENSGSLESIPPSSGARAFQGGCPEYSSGSIQIQRASRFCEIRSGLARLGRGRFHLRLPQMPTAIR